MSKTVKYRNSSGKIVAESIDDTMIKKVKKSRHYFYNMQGWGMDNIILDKAKESGVKVIKVIDVEEEKTYVVSLEDFITYGVDVNYGHGAQKILSGQYWKIDNQLQLKLEL